MIRDDRSHHFEPTCPHVAVPGSAPEETLVSDARAGLTPAEMVEQKLISILHSAPLPVDRFQAAGDRRLLS